jgi:hypothetical protein
VNDPRSDPLSLVGVLTRQSAVLAAFSLDVFLEYDFLDHNILDGRLTGGHIVTYLAREADRMADELLAATGQPVPAPDRSRRWELSEGGNERPGAVLVDDIHESSARLSDAVASVPDWSALPDEIREIPAHRLLQLVVHLADLGRGWGQLADDDASVAASVLPEVLEQELSGYRLTARGPDSPLQCTRSNGVVSVAGAPRLLLAWATGRTDGLPGLPPDLPMPTLRVWI